MSLMKKLSDPEAQDVEAAARTDHLPARRPSQHDSHDHLDQIITQVQERLLGEMKVSVKPINLKDPVAVRNTVEDILTCLLAEEGIPLSRPKRHEILELVLAEVIGLGPLEPLLADAGTTDIMVVGIDKVYVERKGKLYPTSVRFRSYEHLKRIIDRILAPLGRRVDDSSPTADARLPDGSRVNVVMPPVALDGPTLTIRKFSVVPFSIDDLVEFGTATPEAFRFLNACVLAGLNIIVSGGSSSGKTTLLNVLSGFIPDHERIVTIENAAELQLRQPHVVRMESRPPNIEDTGEISVRDLVINSLRMRPDRIVVGEVRSTEAIDLLQAMNTGHDGSMGTLHANSARDALARLETMVLGAGMNLPVRAIREQMASAINLIIHMGRARDGTRRILLISEVEGIEVDTIRLSDIFRYESRPGDPYGGEMVATGIEPRCLLRLSDAGVVLPASMFMPPPWMATGIRTIESSAYANRSEDMIAERVAGRAAEPPARPRVVEPQAPPVEDVAPPVEQWDPLADTVLDEPMADHLDAAGILSLDESAEDATPSEPPAHPKTPGLLSRLHHDEDGG